MAPLGHHTVVLSVGLFITDREFLTHMVRPHCSAIIKQPWSTMIKENTLTVKTISTNILRHVNNYIIEKHGSKEKNVIINGFQSSFKN